MGKTTGFIEYQRVLPVLRGPVERVHDWSEFHGHLAATTLQEQAGRCMDCGVPFCHTGTMLGGAASGCPLHNLIPDWNHLVFTGNWRGALDLLHKTNNFPEFTGRVCPAPCEGSCVLGIEDEPVTIKSIECAIVDRGFAEGWIVPEPPLSRTGKRVAIVGSGPAGLACGAELNKAGHWVTVFEKSDRIGGLLMYGIPNMKLEKSLVQRRVDLLTAEGITFLTKTEVGSDFPSKALKEEFDAVVLCGGASKPRDLTIEGRNLKGIHFAMDFLHSNTKSLLDSQHNDRKYISAAGKDVIVIGGGDTGTDCVGTALRQGCKSLVQFEILPEPGESRAPENPWPQWPRIHRVDYGQEEAIAFSGSDPRRYAIKSQAFNGDSDGNVEGIRTVQIEWQNSTNGAPVISERSETSKMWPAQLILIAMGFLGPPREGLVSDLKLETTDRGSLKVDENKMTNVEGVFAAGDIERGQSLVVWAIADGRKAAKAVNQFLRDPNNLIEPALSNC
jgi:glutamate synthase (NADPH/NADH) small chain